MLKFVTLSILDVLAEFFQECLIGEYSVDCVNVLPWDAQPVPSLLEAVSLFLLPDQVRDVLSTQTGQVVGARVEEYVLGHVEACSFAAKGWRVLPVRISNLN